MKNQSIFFFSSNSIGDVIDDPAASSSLHHGASPFAHVAFSPFRNDSLLHSRQHVIQGSAHVAQSISEPAHVACFRYSNVEERLYYLEVDRFASCFVEDLCLEEDEESARPRGGIWGSEASPRGSEPGLRFTAPMGTRKPGEGGVRWGGEKIVLKHRGTLISIHPRDPGKQKQKGAQNGNDYDHLPYPVVPESSMTIFWTPFAESNAYHEIVEFAASLFETSFNSNKDYYDQKNLKFDRDLRVFLLSSRTSTAPFEKDILGAISRHPITYLKDLKKPVCFQKAWFSLPFFVRADSRFELRYSPFKAKTNPIRMLFAREIVRFIYQRRFENQTFVFDRQQDLPDVPSVVKKLAEEEIMNFWPLQSPDSPRGTSIVFIRRIQKRQISNWEELMTRFEEELGTRGYKIQILKFEGMKAPEQVMKTSRATVMIGGHGAGLSHAMWMQPGSVLLELRRRQNNRCFFQFLCSDHGIKYLLYQPQRPLKTLTRTGIPEGGSIDSDFEVEVDVVMEQIKVALFISDQKFGVSANCTKPISVEELASAAAALQGIHINNNK